MTEEEAVDFLDLTRRISGRKLGRMGLARYIDDCVGYIALQGSRRGRKCDINKALIDFLKLHGPYTRTGNHREGVSLAGNRIIHANRLQRWCREGLRS